MSHKSFRSEYLMRVLYVAEAFGGGVFEMTRLQAEGLAAHGHQVGIAYGCRPETPRDVASVVSDGVELFPMPWVDRSFGAQVRATCRLRQVVREFWPDIVHLQSSFAGIIGAVAISRRLPTVYTPHGYSFRIASSGRARRWTYRVLEQHVGRRVDVVAACSHAEAAEARAIGARNVRVVENGIPELDQQPASNPGRHNVVLAIGRIADQRQPEACARILSAVSDEAQVQWVGGGRVESRGALALASAGVPVSGWLDRESVMRRLAEATVYLHWTAWDGLPLSILEAMAHRTVVIASDIPPNREVLGPDQVFRSEEDAIRMVRSVIHDDELRSDLLAAQDERAAHYGSQRMVADCLGLYDQVLAGRRAASP
jgi:glycosyltransferase involved in cell wall biosynthesis